MWYLFYYKFFYVQIRRKQSCHTPYLKSRATVALSLQCANIQSTGNLLCLFEFDCPVKSLTPQRVSNRTSQVPQETLKPSDKLVHCREEKFDKKSLGTISSALVVRPLWRCSHSIEPFADATTRQMVSGSRQTLCCN